MTALIKLITKRRYSLLEAVGIIVMTKFYVDGSYLIGTLILIGAMALSMLPKASGDCT